MIFESIDAGNVVARFFKSRDDGTDMVFAVGLAGDFQLNFFEAVCNSGLIVLQLSNIGMGVSEYLRDSKELTRLVR